MAPISLPATAAWRHLDVRVGCEVLVLRREPDGLHFEGHSTAVESDEVWGIRYSISLNRSWTTSSAHIVGLSARGTMEVRLAGDGVGGWMVDDRPAPQLAGCLDVDLEASALTNAFPVHRLRLDVGQRAEAPAVYVRAANLRVERLEQSYSRLPDDGEHSRYEYSAPVFDFTTKLVYDEYGLVLEYPGIAVRVA